MIRHIKDAAATIDKAISTALQRKKPVYLEIPVNVVSRLVATPSPLSMIPPPQVSCVVTRWPCEQLLILFFKTSRLPPPLSSPLPLTSTPLTHPTATDAVDPFARLASSLGCGVAVMPDAKGLFPEQDPRYMGTLWAGGDERMNESANE